MDCLREARRLLKGANPAPAEVADLLLAEAHGLVMVEGLLAAADRARQAVDLRHRCSGESHPATAYAMLRLAGSLGALDRVGEAADLVGRARDALAEALGEGHPRYAAALEVLAMIAAARGQPREAEGLARRALAINREALGDRHGWVADGHGVLARALQAGRLLTAAAEEFEAALGAYQGRYGDDHPATAMLRLDRAELWEVAGRGREAGQLHSFAEEIA